MTKPDDIPQDVTLKANQVWHDLVGAPDRDAQEQIISSAIMSARAEEREACAKIAEDEDGARPGWGEHRNMVVAQQVAQEIAAAIRNRP